MATQTVGTDETGIAKWTRKQTVQWAEEHFNEEVAKCFEGTVYVLSLVAS